MVCQLCHSFTHTKPYLFRHIQNTHKVPIKEYYDKYIKLPKEGLCRICGKPTHWSIAHHCYGNYCSRVCVWKDPIVIEKRKQHCLKKFGTEFAFQAKEVRQKILDSTEKRYGKPYILQTEIGQLKRSQQMTPEKELAKELKRQETNFKTYGTKHPSQLDSVKQKMYDTNQLKYGCDLPTQNPDILAKINNTNLKNHGVKWNMQRPDVIKKMMKAQENVTYCHKKYVLPSGKIINLQGYEPQFLDYIFKNNILKEDEIIPHPNSIMYYKNHKKHFYYPDFYIPKWNLIIEIKSTWTLKLDKNLKLKEKATIKNGFKYCRIINILSSDELDFSNLQIYLTSTPETQGY